MQGRKNNGRPRREGAGGGEVIEPPINYTELKSLFGCMVCWPKLCYCKCPHGIGLNHPCESCKRFEEDE